MALWACCSLLVLLYLLLLGAILITVAQRRIPIQQAKHTRGRKTYGGARHYLPLRVNHAGVMPIIFGSSLLIFPSAFFGYLQTAATASPDPSSWWVATTSFLNQISKWVNIHILSFISF